MSAERQLAEAYREWRHLAEIEGESITGRNWTLVAACQKALQDLQGRISRLTPAARNEWPKSDRERAVRERALNAVIRELIGLERRNQTLLNGLREAARLKLGQLAQAGRNLEQIQQSYGSAVRR
ncbi:MAG TPA: hypothetical protein VMA35_14825 [Candidatus Sulfopaludibacter sp.]|nr:hypothetical protein [Candidatus Sulfopaludibacter sp.]